MDEPRSIESGGGRVFSLEFFPPKTAQGTARFRAAHAELTALRPSYISVTSGAGGSADGDAWELVRELSEDAGYRGVVAPHVTAILATRASIRQLLARYTALGIRRIVVVRGDIPPGMSGPGGEFGHANELVAFIRAETGDQFHIEVAAHPEFHSEAPSVTADLENFKRKVGAGASSALTQYFYNSDAYVWFVLSCARLGVTLPIVPGIMPITSYARLARFSDAVGVEIPRWLRRRLDAFGEDLESLRAFGVDVVARLCERLLEEGAPGLHFYTMNSAEPTLSIWKRLGLPRSHPAVRA
jgi:methylenetetrahydrofolate reductase (NADH)